MKEVVEANFSAENRPISEELISWARLFDADLSAQCISRLGTGHLLRRIFMQIDGAVTNETTFDAGVDDTKNRLDNWRSIAQNLRNYYLEVLQEVITMRPPNLVMISKLPDSIEAQREIEHFILLLLCAAVRCERRDYFIGQIVEHLSSETQAGLMNCIQNFTENSQCILSVDCAQSCSSGLIRKFCDIISHLEDTYIEEVHKLLDQLNALQSRFSALQAVLQTTRRGRVASSRINQAMRSVSTLSLGTTTHAELASSTPRPEFSREDNVSNLMRNRQATAHPNDETSYLTGLQRGFADFSSNPNWNSSDELTAHFSGCIELVDSGALTASAERSGLHDIPDLYQDTIDSLHPGCDDSRITAEVTELKAELRRARAEIEDQTDQLNELHDQLNETRQELNRVKEERARLADAALSARHWQDEVDALRESVERVQRLEEENTKLRHRVCEVDYYKTRCEQLTDDLTILTEQHLKGVNDHDGDSGTRDTLIDELNKARLRLADVEKLRSADLDEISKLREEIGRLHLEQCNFNNRKSSKFSFPLGITHEQIFQTNRCVSSTDVSDVDTSEGQFARVLESSTPNLSVQLRESIPSRLEILGMKDDRATWSTTEITQADSSLNKSAELSQCRAKRNQCDGGEATGQIVNLCNGCDCRVTPAEPDDIDEALGVGNNRDAEEGKEGVDSGNKTGEETAEEASVEASCSERTRSTRSDDCNRRSTTGACSESGTVTWESEAEHGNRSSDSLKKHCGLAELKLSQKQQDTGVVKHIQDVENIAHPKTAVGAPRHTEDGGTHVHECRSDQKEADNTSSRQNVDHGLSTQTRGGINKQSQLLGEYCEQSIMVVNKQLKCSQDHVANLITTNARLQVENATLHSQVDSLSGQNTLLSSRTAELKIEVNRLKSMVEEAHTAEAQISTDYYSLRRLHEELSMDYDALKGSLQEALEVQRQLKCRLSKESAEVSRLRSTSGEVQVLKNALEAERDTLKDESKQFVLLQEDCSRLRMQVNSLKEERNRELAEKSSIEGKARDAVRKFDEARNKLKEVKAELTERMENEQKCKIQMNNLQSQIQVLSRLNSKLEKENRSLILQLESLLGQNRGLLSSNMEEFTQHTAKEGVMNDLSHQSVQESQRRMTLVQKARAALTKKKELESLANSGRTRIESNGMLNPHRGREKPNSMQSQYSSSNESDGSFASSMLASGNLTTSSATPVPGSVSVYDRDADEVSTSEFQAFLQRLDKHSSDTSVKKVKPKKQDPSGYSTGSASDFDNHLYAQTEPKRRGYSNGILGPNAVHGALHSNGIPETTETPNNLKLIRSSASHHMDQGHYFPRGPLENVTQNSKGPHEALNQMRSKMVSCEPREPNKCMESRTRQRGGEFSKGPLYEQLPATDRCEKQLFEVVTVKSTCENLIAGLQKRQGLKVSRSSSMRSFSPSCFPNSNNTLKRVSSPLFNITAGTQGNTAETRFDRSHSCIRPPEEPKGREAEVERGGDQTSIGWKDYGLHSLEFTRPKSSMSSTLSSGANIAEENTRSSFDCCSKIDGNRSLEVATKPRVVLEYGDL